MKVILDYHHSPADATTRSPLSVLLVFAAGVLTGSTATGVALALVEPGGWPARGSPATNIIWGSLLITELNVILTGGIACLRDASLRRRNAYVRTMSLPWSFCIGFISGMLPLAIMVAAAVAGSAEPVLWWCTMAAPCPVLAGMVLVRPQRPAGRTSNKRPIHGDATSPQNQCGLPLPHPSTPHRSTPHYLTDRPRLPRRSQT